MFFLLNEIFVVLSAQLSFGANLFALHVWIVVI